MGRIYEVIMPKRTKKYENSLVESLKDPYEAAAYLNAHLEDSEAEDSEKLFLLALRDVATAFGMTDIAQVSSLGRESLYKSLSATGNPKLTTLKAILAAMDLEFSIQPKNKVS